MYKIVFSKKAAKSLEVIGKSDQKLGVRIINAIESLSDDPKKGKALKLDLKGLFSLRVGTYRIIYKIVKNKLLVQIIDVGYRKQIYGVR